MADELYEVRKKNAGMADKEYYGKKEHDEKFTILDVPLIESRNSYS